MQTVMGYAQRSASIDPGPPAPGWILDRSSVNLNAMTPDAVDSMAAAGAEVCEWERVLARTGDNVVGELLRSQGAFREWELVPKGGVYDPISHGQYFYHAHPKSERVPGEHGHFHTFVRGEPYDPTSVTETAGPASCRAPGPLCHLIGVSMDRDGRLMRLFTTNRWVTGEAWQSADEVIAKLDWFSIGLARPSWPTNRWLTAVIQLFRPQIEILIRARDEVVAAWQAAHPDRDVFEDRALNVTSEMSVTAMEQIEAVAKAKGHRV
ncbi:MAG: hypothetical protein ACFCVH_03935 [Alphaproteobacteria bacterium]